MAVVFRSIALRTWVGRVEGMSSPCLEGQENWILSNKGSQENCRVSKDRCQPVACQSRI